MRKARGLSQKDLAEVSSRTYVSKLERGQSSPTLEMMATLSAPLGLSPLTLVAVTISAETGQPIRSLISRLEEEIGQLNEAGVLGELQTPLATPSPANRVRSRARGALPPVASNQTEFCFGD
ncbi:helix-turn-helix domain-containing protein [Pseudomonas sp. LS-2]|uniref:helix-turn-helix domain-containing protein n=1 Tax=Pseudomonas sp. LS-2 TaxID=2315859 RepID=UPI0035C82BEE